MCDKEKDRQIAHLEKLREDIRDEIKKRIGQRDSYSMQLTIALGAIMAIAFAPKGYREVLIAAPFVLIYYIALILYSYEIHRFAAEYLRDKIEHELARLCGTLEEIEWETYYKAEDKVIGIRSLFFLAILIILSSISMGHLWFIRKSIDLDIPLWVLWVAYMVTPKIKTKNRPK